MTEDPRARGVSSDEIDRAQEMARRGAAAQTAVNELGAGEVQVVSTPTIYVALRGQENDGYTEGMAARTSLESAQSVVEAEAASREETLSPWKQLASGTWFTRVPTTVFYYEVLALRVLP